MKTQGLANLPRPLYYLVVVLLFLVTILFLAVYCWHSIRGEPVPAFVQTALVPLATACGGIFVVPHDTPETGTTKTTDAEGENP